MADTFNYFVAGYAVIFGLLGLYVGYLLFLAKKLKPKKEEDDN
jgi:hypothetical protein